MVYFVVYIIIHVTTEEVEDRKQKIKNLYMPSVDAGGGDSLAKKKGE